MKIASLILAVSTLLSQNNNLVTKNFNKDEFIKEVFYLQEQHLPIYEKESKVDFVSGTGTLSKYYVEDKLVGSILTKEGEIKAIYYDNYLPFVGNVDDYICVKPFKFVLKDEFINEEENEIEIYSNNTFNLSGKSFFEIKNKDNLIYTYSSTYLSEVKLKDVPNYMNTQFYNSSKNNYYGCTPTTAVMYFSYIDRNGVNCQNLIEGVLPISHNNDKKAVDNFIYNLGINYFETTINGTYWSMIPKGYTNYLKARGFGDYKAYKWSSSEIRFDNIANILKETGNPIDVDLAKDHSVLAVGTRSLFNGEKNNNLITVHDVQPNSMSVASYSMSAIRNFHIIYK